MYERRNGRFEGAVKQQTIGANLELGHANSGAEAGYALGHVAKMCRDVIGHRCSR